MLHFAPEKIFKFRLKGLQRLEYHTADLFQPGTTFSVDIENTPFPENTYDVAYCTMSWSMFRVIARQCVNYDVSLSRVVGQFFKYLYCLIKQ